MKNVADRKALIADISLLLVALIWGGGFIAAKIALSCVTPFYLLAFRFMCSGLLLVAIFFKKISKIDKKSILSGIVLGIILYVGQTLQTIGLKYTDAGRQAFLIASYTVLVPFISWMLTKKKPTILSILSGFLTLIGIGLLSLQQSLSLTYGDTLTLLFAIMFAFQIVFIGLYAKNIDPIHLTTIQLLTAGTLASISALIFEQTIEFINYQSMTGILYLVIFNTTIAFLVQNIAQKYTSDTHTSIIISLEAIFGCFLSIIILGEVFTKRMFIGSILIFIAVILSQASNKILNFKGYIIKFLK